MSYRILVTNQSGIENLVVETTSESFANAMLDRVSSYWIEQGILSPFGYLDSGRIEIVTP